MEKYIKSDDLFKSMRCEKLVKKFISSLDSAYLDYLKSKEAKDFIKNYKLLFGDK